MPGYGFYSIPNNSVVHFQFLGNPGQKRVRGPGPFSEAGPGISASPGTRRALFSSETQSRAGVHFASNDPQLHGKEGA